MSKRNSQASKTAARERLRQERERQAKRAKAKRQIIVAGSVVAVLATAGGIGYAVVQANKPSDWEAAKDEKLVKPANTTGTDGTTVVIGKSTAKKTLVMYEDPRCPVCAQFEQTVGSTVKKDLDAGKFKIQYVGATFIDNNINGRGLQERAERAGRGAERQPRGLPRVQDRAVLDEVPPGREDDKFKDDAYLIKVANTVSALKNNKTFQKAVKKGTYDTWALEMCDKFNTDGKKYGVQGTPTLRMDGKTLTGSDGKNAPMTVADFNTAMNKALNS